MARSSWMPLSSSPVGPRGRSAVVAEKKKRLELEVDGREVSISNPDKVLFPDDGITKAEIVRYYEKIGPRLVHLSQGRPVALHRFPDGIGKGGFFQKQKGKHFPD